MKHPRLVGPVTIAAVIVLIAATVSGYALVPPGTLMPVHWGPDGTADAFWPRDTALLMPPVVVVSIAGLFWLVLARGRGVERALAGLRVALAGIAMLMAAIQIASIAIALGYPVDMVRVIAGAIGILFIALGNIMPKSQPNSYAGIRVRWTMASPANWLATNRLTGMLMMLGGIALVIAALFVAQPLLLLGIIVLASAVPSLVGIIYSYRFARREDAARPS